MSTLVSIPLFWKRFQLSMRTKFLSMMLLKIIMREEYMLVGVAIISSFLSMCWKSWSYACFYFPMQVDSCSHKLFAHKIPMHRKWVRLKCARNILHDALFMFQFLSFMWASLKSSCLARKALKKKRLLGDNPIFTLTVFVCLHD